MRPSGSAQPRGRLVRARLQRRERRRLQDRVGEERAGAHGVRVVRVHDHALRAPQREHCVADLRQGRTIAELDAERAGELGVGDGPRERGALEGERHREHHPAAGGALEGARAVREAAVLRAELLEGLALAVVDRDRRDRLGHVLPVGADVLDRRRAGRPRDPRQALDPRQAVLDAPGHDGVPLLTGLDGDRDPVAVAPTPGCPRSERAPRCRGSPRRRRRRCCRRRARAPARRRGRAR